MKMNFLMVMPKFLEDVDDEKIFPLGMAYVSASMKKAGFNVFNLNLNLCRRSLREELEESILKNKIHVVMTGGLSFQYSILYEIVSAVNEIREKMRMKLKIIMGGGIVTGDPETAMEALQYVDYGIMGEGEVTACELARALESDQTSFSNIDGIIYREGRGWIRNRERGDIENLDELPFPDYEGFGFGEHIRSIRKKSDSTLDDTRKQLNNIYIIGSRSCPFNCTFCFHTCGKKYRQRSLDNIFAEIDYLVENYEISGTIGIQDELFSYDKKRIFEFCKRIKNYGLKWWAQFRVDTLDLEIIEVLQDSNCSLIGFGLESADNRILKSMRKGTKIEQIERTLKAVYESGLSFIGTFIFGDIEETKETAYNTLRWWKEHMEYRIDLRLIMIYPGSYLYKYAVERGLIKDPVAYLKAGCPQINVSKLTDEEFGQLSQDIMRLPMENEVKFQGYHLDQEYLSVRCGNCGAENTYKDVLFFIGSHLPCHRCGQKHTMPVFDEVVERVDQRLALLKDKYEKIAIWAINVQINDFIWKSKMVDDKNVFLIDLSTMKQKMIIHGKRVYSPEVLRSENIRCVIVGVSSYKKAIESNVRENFVAVEEVLDINYLVYGY